MKILDRYFLWEFLRSFLGVLSVFSLLILLHQILGILGEVSVENPDMYQIALYFIYVLPGQILQVVPRNSFLRLVYECGAERHAKGFSSWDQCVAMLFCQLAQAKSLREISDGLAVTCGKLSHLGLRAAPAKSTLSYANAHRPWQLYQNTFFHLRDLCRSESPGKKKKFRQ